MENEIIFIIEEDSLSGYTARALGHSIFTEAEDLEALRDRIREAVKCHFDYSEESLTILLVRS